MTVDRSRFEISPDARGNIVALQGRTMDQLLAAIEQDAQRLAPVDTGNLRSKISTEKTDETSGRLISDADYAVFVEMGTSRAPAQPFMRPSVYRQRSV